ncbi:MAG: hypothetical protein EAZ53_00195 [Bacteroidetes bacterium]|nr:MAG: hypothetical protein EAZ53_00195 [Bacteroidota bacterium]
MITNGIINKWKIEHYVGYLYLAVSFADSKLLKEEVDMCYSKLEKFLNRYYPDSIQSPSPSPILDEIIYEIKHHSIPEMNETIKNLNQIFVLSEETKEDIVSDLSDIESADDEVDIEEHKMISYVRGLFFGEPHHTQNLKYAS